jgi:hypothetical protein
LLLVRRLFLALSVLSLVLTACGGADETPIVKAQSQTPSPTPEPEVAPLTGEPVEDSDVLDRPVLAVKIDNAVPARPQAGLAAADVVYEEVVEGGSTRFVALYQSTAADSVGPVRSGRDVDAVLLPPYHPLFVISGAADPTYEVLRGADLKVREEGQPEDAFRRADDRKRPYNLFVDVGRMFDVAGDDGLPAARAAWRFGPTEAGEPADGVDLRFSPSMPVRWTWDDAAGRWRRQQVGAAHLDSAGEQVAFENVVILRVPVAEGGGVDALGSRTQDITVTGSGDAMILRDGKAISGVWRKESATDHFSFVTVTGAVLPLAPGRTWVELLPVGSPLSVDRPTVSPSGAANPSDAPR